MPIQGDQDYRVAIADENGLLETLFSVEGNSMKDHLENPIPLLGVPNFYILVRATICNGVLTAKILYRSPGQKVRTNLWCLKFQEFPGWRAEKPC